MKIPEIPNNLTPQEVSKLLDWVEEWIKDYEKGLKSEAELREFLDDPFGTPIRRAKQQIIYINQKQK